MTFHFKQNPNMINKTSQEKQQKPEGVGNIFKVLIRKKQKTAATIKQQSKTLNPEMLSFKMEVK